MDVCKNVKVENIVAEEPKEDVISLQLKKMRDLCDANQDVPRLCSATQDVAQLRDTSRDIWQLEECHLCLSVLRRGPAFFAHQGLPHPFPCLLQCGRHFPDLLLLHSHHLEHHRAPNMVAAAGLLFCPTCNQVWPPGSEEQHSPPHHLSCDLCPLVLQGGLKGTMVLHRWRAHGVTGDSEPGDNSEPALPMSSGNPSSTSHCSSAASTTTSTSGSPEAEKRLKRKLERGEEDDQGCTEVRRGVIKDELERCRKAQEGGSSKKRRLVEADVILENSLSQTWWFGEVLKQNCHVANVEPLEDGEIDISDDSRVEVIGEKTGGDRQMMPCNKLVKDDVPHWCSLCNVQLTDDTPQGRRVHNHGRRHQAAIQERHHQASLQEFRALRPEMGRSGRESESPQSRITNDDETAVSALARLGDQRSVVFVPKSKDRRNVVARLGEKVPELTPQRKIELWENQREKLTDELSEQLSDELDEEQGGDLRERLRDRSRRYLNSDKRRTYQDLDKVETRDRVVVERRKVEDYGKELEELSTKIQRARYVQESVENTQKVVATISERVVTFGRRTVSQLPETEARGHTENISLGHRVKSENVVKSENMVKIYKGDQRKKVVWP